MPHYDVLIVGAGPAGATAAYFLARAGVKVALIDKRTFPRDKVCGDGVVASSLARLERMSLGPWLAANSFNAPNELLFSAPNGQAVHILPKTRDICYGRIIPRLELDEAILRRALEAGADLLEGLKLTAFNRLGANRVQLSGAGRDRTGGISLDGRLVIAADGAHASFTRSLGLISETPDLVAVRTYFEAVGGPKSLLEIHFDRLVMPGYAWIFPLTEGRANVGLGTHVYRSRQRQVNLKQALAQLAQRNPYIRERLNGARMVKPPVGYPIRARMKSVTPYAANVLVAGEAAGLVNPLNGEGIGAAIISGELAAQHARTALETGNFSAAALRPYQQALRRQIGRPHAVAALLRRLLSLPGVLNRTVRRARRDSDFAQTLLGVIVEAEPPGAILRPNFLLRLLAG